MISYLPRYDGDFFFTVYSICFETKYDANLEIMSCQVLCYQPLHTHLHQDPTNNWRVPFKIHLFARFSLVLLSIHPRYRRGVERIRQGEGRWSRPPKTVLDRSDLNEKFQFRASHTEAETKTTPDRIHKKILIIYICISWHRALPPFFLLCLHTSLRPAAFQAAGEAPCLIYIYCNNVRCEFDKFEVNSNLCESLQAA